MSLQQITIDLKTKQFSSKVIFQHPFWGVDVNFREFCRIKIQLVVWLRSFTPGSWTKTRGRMIST
jgi:hypothetical protein